jgi:hypothetical protein
VPGKHATVFSTSDASSGVLRYDVVENGAITSGATSPYILKDQEDTKEVTVRAVDRAGNVREARTALGAAGNAERPSSRRTLLFGGGMLFFALLLILYALMRKKRYTKGI